MHIYLTIHTLVVTRAYLLKFICGNRSIRSDIADALGLRAEAVIIADVTPSTVTIDIFDSNTAKYMQKLQAELNNPQSTLLRGKTSKAIAGGQNAPMQVMNKAATSATLGQQEVALPTGWSDVSRAPCHVLSSCMPMLMTSFGRDDLRHVHALQPWHTAGDGSNGYTFDYARNGLVNRFDSWARLHRQRARFDRFWTRLNRYTATHMEVLGLTPMEPRRCPLPTPSADAVADDDEPTATVLGCELPDAETCVDDNAQLLKMTHGRYDCAMLANHTEGCNTLLPQDPRLTVTCVNG